MDYEEWIEKYKPIDNHLDTNAGWDGKCFETFGEEADFCQVKAQTGTNQVWTLIEGDEDSWWIVAGWHFVNRFGYFITEVPYEDETIEIEVT